MTAPTPLEEALAKVPTIEETPGLVAPWQMIEGAHELWHRGRWLLLERAEPVRGEPLGPDRAPVVALTLEGPTEILTIRTIDPTTGLVDARQIRRHAGPVLLRTVDVLCRARLRSSDHHERTLVR